MFTFPPGTGRPSARALIEKGLITKVEFMERLLEEKNPMGLILKHQAGYLRE